MMRVDRDLWLCVDCTIAAANDDYTGMSEERAEVVAKAIGALPHLSAHFDCESGEGHETFSRRDCDCCHSGLAGEFHRFALLVEIPRHHIADLPHKEAPLWWHLAGIQFTASGYGSRIPTTYMVQLPGSPRWRRVYSCCYSNAGTAYVGKPGKWEAIIWGSL